MNGAGALLRPSRSRRSINPRFALGHSLLGSSLLRRVGRPETASGAEFRACFVTPLDGDVS